MYSFQLGQLNGLVEKMENLKTRGIKYGYCPIRSMETFIKDTIHAYMAAWVTIGG